MGEIDSRVILFSDLHLHLWPEFAVVDHRGHSRLRDGTTVIDAIARYCRESGVKHVFFGGDLFHVTSKEGKVAIEVLNAGAASLQRLKAAGVTVWAVPGNHDQTRRDGSQHALQSLFDGGLLNAGRELEPGVHVAQIDDFRVEMFAYCDNAAELIRRVDVAYMDAISARASHPTLRTGLFHHGFSGAQLSEMTEYQVKDPVDVSKLIGLYEWLFSGHYHLRQQIHGHPHAWYIGSPLEHTRSDRSSLGKKGFLLFDLYTRDLKLIPLKRPRFVTLDMADPAVFDKQISADFLDITYDPAWVDAETLTERAQELGARGVRLHKKLTVIAAKPRLALPSTLSEATVLSRYARYKQKELEAEGLDLDDVVELGKDLLQEVL